MVVQNLLQLARWQAIHEVYVCRGDNSLLDGLGQTCQTLHLLNGLKECLAGVASRQQRLHDALLESVLRIASVTSVRFANQPLQLPLPNHHQV